MKRRTLVALLGAIAVAAAASSGALAATASSGALAATSGPAVTVKIQTLTKTLRHAVVHGEKGWITKGGAPKGTCSGSSGAGALDAATHGKWTAKYYASLHEIFITSILGVKPKGSDFWEIFVNGKAASTGACGIHLRGGEKLLFKIAK